MHAVEVAGNPHNAGSATMLDRGHLDHVALTAASLPAFQTLRQRLVERGASNGNVDDLGAFYSLWFDDPDGMQVELPVIVDPTLQGIHEPRPMSVAAD